MVGISHFVVLCLDRGFSPLLTTIGAKLILFIQVMQFYLLIPFFINYLILFLVCISSTCVTAATAYHIVLCYLISKTHDIYIYAMSVEIKVDR